MCVICVSARCLCVFIVCQRALFVSFVCQHAVCVFVVCQCALFVSFGCQRAVCVFVVCQRALCVCSIRVSALCVCHLCVSTLSVCYVCQFVCQRAVLALLACCLLNRVWSGAKRIRIQGRGCFRLLSFKYTCLSADNTEPLHWLVLRFLGARHWLPVMLRPCCLRALVHTVTHPLVLVWETVWTQRNETKRIPNAGLGFPTITDTHSHTAVHHSPTAASTGMTFGWLDRFP